VSPLSCDESGNILNINADTVAAAIAAELDAEKLILVTGASGILEDINDTGSLISYIDRKHLQELKEKGVLADGMLPKAAAIDSAIQNGVQRVHVISYKLPDSILLEVFTNEGTGTLVVNDINALTPEEQDFGRKACRWMSGYSATLRAKTTCSMHDWSLTTFAAPSLTLRC
jgi:acetylglutamate kinase